MKFSLLRECWRRFCIPYKILLVMRLTFILMSAVLLQASAEGYAQKITLSKKSASLLISIDTAYLYPAIHIFLP